MRIVIFILLLFVLWRCAKPLDDDLSGRFELKGTLLLNDTLKAASGIVPLKKVSVQLRDASDAASLNYFLSTLTDTLGNFAFTNLSDKNYWLSSMFSKDSVTYAFDTTINPAKLTGPLALVIYPAATNSNVLSIIARDDATKGTLPNVTICLFTSSLFAKANLCDGSFQQIKTDAFGRAITTKLPVGKYYINARDSVGAIDIRVKDSVDILQPTGFAYKIIYLK